MHGHGSRSRGHHQTARHHAHPVRDRDGHQEVVRREGAENSIARRKTCHGKSPIKVRRILTLRSNFQNLENIFKRKLRERQT